MKIAIVGAGIAGMTAAWLLNRSHDIQLFEANDYLGGHTRTVDVSLDGQDYAVDTGFIVFNDWTYPNFIKLLDTLGVQSQPTEMSFSVRCDRSGLEYNGNSLNTLFAQRRNLFRPRFHRMLRDIVRFNRESLTLLEQSNDRRTLAQFLRQENYSQPFIEHYIVPMAAAIWSAEPELMTAVPARFFVQFFKNHGLLNINNRPQWRVIQGGSRNYVKPLTSAFSDKIRLSCPIERIQRRPDRVDIKPHNGPVEHYDQVIIASHSDQALAMLADPSDRERAILGAIPYQENSAVLHTDTSLLPRRKRAVAAWNYHIPVQAQKRVAVTYNMNILQNLHVATGKTFCVTLNYENVLNPRQVLARMVYHHPVFTAASVAAQQRHVEISGVNRTWYCGAYWGYGFHEDGVNSALHIGEQLAQQRLVA